MQIRVYQGEVCVHQLLWDAAPVSIGRAGDNALILQHPDVSGHHALLFLKAGVPHCRDLGSTNGTFLNGNRIVESVVNESDVLVVGGFSLRLAVMEEIAPGWTVREQGASVALPVESGMSLDDHPEAVLFVEDTLWLDLGGTPVPLEEAVPFELGGRTYLIERSTAVAPTVQRDPVLPYRLEVELDENRAALTQDGLPPVSYRAASRVALLYVLSRAVGSWVEDAELGTGIWGREWVLQGANNLNVLIHRVRKQAVSAGYDKRFLERRRGALRLRVAEAITR